VELWKASEIGAKDLRGRDLKRGTDHLKIGRADEEQGREKNQGSGNDTAEGLTGGNLRSEE